MSDSFIMSEYAFGTIGTYRDVPIDALTNPDHPLTPVQIRTWATLEAALSHSFKQGTLPPSSHFDDGMRYISEVMNDLDHTFLHEFSDFNTEYLAPRGFREFFRKRLEDPGMLHNAVYFGVGKDPTTVSFYWHIWRGDIVKSMDFFHGFAWSPYGNCARVDESSAWHHYSAVEGMNHGERIKISDYVDRLNKLAIQLNRPIRIACLGNSLPERHYTLPKAEITIFDNGNYPPLFQLFPNPTDRRHVHVIHTDLLTAIEHPDLFGTQDVVSMLGAAQCLGELDTIQTIIFGEKLLRDKGMLVFDLSVKNESLRRYLTTQFPIEANATNLMLFNSASEAMTVGMDLIYIANETLEKKRVILTSAPPIVTKVGAWGYAGVRFYLKKHVL